MTQARRQFCLLSGRAIVIFHSIHAFRITEGRFTMKKLAALLIALPLLAGCNTIAGAGKDVEATGKVINKTAEDVKSDIKD